jgi:hypothetical protein
VFHLLRLMGESSTCSDVLTAYLSNNSLDCSFLLPLKHTAALRLDLESVNVNIEICHDPALIFGLL